MSAPLRARVKVPAGGAGRRVEAPVLVQAAEDGAHELARVLPVISAVGWQSDAQGSGEAFEVFDPGFLKAVDGEIHARAAT